MAKALLSACVLVPRQNRRAGSLGLEAVAALCRAYSLLLHARGSSSIAVFQLLSDDLWGLDVYKHANQDGKNVAEGKVPIRFTQ